MKEKMVRLRGFAERNALRAAVAVVGAVPFLANAQSTDPFDSAVTTITTKVGTYGAALVALSAVGVVFAVAAKYVKKLPRAS